MLDFPDVRIEVLVDSPLVPRIAALAESVGVTSFMLLTTLGGQGSQGRWRRDEVTGTTAKQVFVTVLSAAESERLLAALAPLLASYSLEVVATPARRTRVQMP
jgi:hypothetical protein